MAKIEVITSTERRRKWSQKEKIQILEEASNSTISITARKHKIPASQLFLWRKQLTQVSATNNNNKETNMNIDNIPTSQETLLSQIKRLEQILGRKTLEVEVLKEKITSYITTNPHSRKDLLDQLKGTQLLHL